MVISVLLVIDNYDSFVYNLVQYFGELGADIEVFRNDRISIDKIKKMKPEKIVISPGPGRPENSGICLELIRNFSGKIPILGVCLGHQCIGEVFQAKVDYASKVYHGKTSTISHSGNEILAGIPEAIKVARYHSLEVKEKGLPNELIIIARAEDGSIMGIKHVSHPTFGLQFHPESIASQHGKDILKNFLDMEVRLDDQRGY